MVGVVLWGLAGLLVLIVGILALPVVLRVEADTVPRPRLRVETRLFGGLAPWLRIYDSATRRPSDEAPQTEADRPPKERKRKATGPRTRRRIAPRAAIRAVLDLASGLLGKFRVVELRLNGTIGLPDPADTGMLFGLAAPLRYGTPFLPRGDISLAPDFTQERFDLTARAAVRVVPLALFGPVIRFGWTLAKARR